MSLLKENLTRLATIRDKWIAINDDTVAPSLAKAVRRILPIPFLFEAIPFRQQADDLASLVVQIDEEIVLLERFRQSEFADPYNRSVASAAVPYARAIRNAVAYLRDIKKRMADGLDKSGPQYSWADYNRDLSQYDALRPDVSLMGERLSAAINSEADTFDTEEHSEVSIEEAVRLFHRSVREHVEQNWQNCFRQLPKLLPSASDSLLRFLSGDEARILIVHAMYAVELCEAHKTYPAEHVKHLEVYSLDAIQSDIRGVDMDFHEVTSRLFGNNDTAIAEGLPPIFGISAALAAILCEHLTDACSDSVERELAIATFFSVNFLKQDWWALFSTQHPIAFTN